MKLTAVVIPILATSASAVLDKWARTSPYLYSLPN